ncbi:MAG: universal stress protein [Alphaproteobacteria bacterium]
MNKLDSLFEVRRILVAFNPMTPGTALLDTAVDFARHIQAELDALFVEDTELMRLAELPFVHELSLPGGTLKPLDIAEIEREWRARAANMRQALEARAQESAIRCSFRVVRGRMDTEVRAAADTADLVMLDRSGGAVTRHARLKSRWNLPATDSPRPVLMLRGRHAEIESIIVLYADAGSSKSALGIAAGMSAKLGMDGSPPQFTVLCFGATGEGAERAEIGAREILKRQGIGAKFRRVSGTAALLAALDMPTDALLVSAASLPGLESDEAERLVADWQGPVLVVR